MTVIDLGELRDEPEPRHSRSRRRANRRWWLPLVLLLTLATVVAAAPPQRLSGITLAIRSAGPVLVVADRLYVAAPATPMPGATRGLWAVALPSGEPLWQVSLPDSGRSIGLRYVAGTLLLAGQPDAGDPLVTEAFDAADGRLRWRQPGRAEPVGDDAVLLREFGAPDGSERPAAGRLSLVDLATGAMRWFRTIPPETLVKQLTEEASGGRLLVGLPGGRLEVWDAATGAPLRGRDLGFPSAESPHSWIVAGDLLLWWQGGTAVAYGLADLAPRWSVPLGHVEGYLHGCGPLVCLYHPAGGVTAVEPATGQVLWVNDRWGAVQEVGGHLLAGSATRSGQAEWALLDPDTGVPRAVLGAWAPLWSDQDGTIPLLVRPGTDNRLTVGELDPAAGTVRTRDVLDGVLPECRANAGWLVCHRLDGTLGGWRLGS